MRNYTIEDFKAEFKRLGYLWLNFHIIGVRSNTRVPDAFNDLIFVVWGNSLYQFTCTTVPGVHWLQKAFMNAKGAFVLKCGQYIDAFGFGKHHGIYECLIQVIPLPGFRDNDGDNIAEEQGEIETGYFGIHIHHASDKITSIIVGAWSAGCQVLNSITKWNEFLGLCKKSNAQKFTYTLLKEF